MITQRTVQQLKKLWANLKQSQREALTREKQSLMATGGGPQEARIDIDPDIASIAPHLMKTAPVIFTSNMTEKAVNGIYKNDLINCKTFRGSIILVTIFFNPYTADHSKV